MRPSPHEQAPYEPGKQEWIMTNKSKHTGLGIALGAALGAVAGVLAGHIAVWLGIGIAIGMALGASFRSKEGECPECAALHRTHETNQKQLQN